MVRAARCFWFVPLLLAAGCTKDEDYLEVFREQRAAYKELADILADVKDEKSMADAQVVLKERAPKFEAISRKASALPKPPPPEVVKRFEDDKFLWAALLERLGKESARVEALPGGRDFMRQFKSNTQGLMSAVKQ